MKKTLLCCLLMISGIINISAQQTKVRSYLEIYNFDTKTHQVIKELPYLIEAPNWTPDGKWLVVNKDGKLYKTAPDGSTDLILIDTKDINQCNNDHVISADGKWIALSSNDPANKGWNSYVYTVPFEGGEPKKITPIGPSYLHGISPDGKMIAYCAFRGPDNEQDVYVMPVKGGKEVRLTDAPGLDDGPEYSMDGKYYLHLCKGSASYERYSKACVQAIEFAYLYSAEADRLLHLREHGECLIEEQALKKLK